MALVVLVLGLIVVVAFLVYRNARQAKRDAAEKSAKLEADRTASRANLERIERTVAALAALKTEKPKGEFAKTSVEFKLGPQEKALREAAVTCAHRGSNPVPAFITHGGAAVILEFNAPWTDLFARKPCHSILGSIKCACGKNWRFGFSMRGMTWALDQVCEQSVVCDFCDRAMHLTLTTQGPTALLFYICPSLEQDELPEPVEIVVDDIGIT